MNAETEGELKRCRVCGLLKPLSDFPKRSDTGRHRNECKDCKANYLKKYRDSHKGRISELGKEYRLAHKGELDEYRLAWQRSHKTKVRSYQRKYAENMSDEQKAHRRELEHAYRERWNQSEDYKKRRREWDRQSSKRRRKSITAYEEARKKSDPEYKLKCQLRNSIRAAFQRRGSTKDCHTEEIVGCKIGELYEHLCASYEERYGEKWNGQDVHIDHIVPLSNAHSYEDIIKLCHYTNLQLLKPEDNLEKSDTVDWEQD